MAESEESTGRSSDLAGGFTLLDGAALVAGAAVAAVHIRGAIRGELLGPGWVVLWLAFFWIALTAAGPFLYLVRRYLRPVPGYPRVGDRLWAILGLPWVATTILHGTTRTNPPSSDLLMATLPISLGIVSLVALAVVWGRWVMVTPGEASRTFAGPWTNRTGLILSIAWPLQCGVGMVVIG
ncbi:MAG: hypothetical protein U0794_06095 [Isosphaeraceae bacterium]